MYANEINESSIKVTPTPGWVQSLPTPRSLGGWLVYERNGPTIAIPDVWFGGNVRSQT